MASSHNLPLSQAQRIATAEVLPEFTDRLKLEEKNPRKIPFTVEELKSIQKSVHAARSHAENGMKRASLRHVVDAITKAFEDASGIGSIPATDRLYQFKITLLEVILHAVRNDAVAFLAIVPSPPKLIFQLDKFSTGGEG